MTETLVGPLLAYPTGKLLGVDHASKLMCGKGDEHSVQARRLRDYAQSGLVQVRDLVGTGPNARQKFDLLDVFAAKILGILADAGLADKEIKQVVSAAMYHGSPKGEKGTWLHPLSKVLFEDIRGGKLMAFRVDVCRNRETGERVILTDFCDMSVMPTMPDPARYVVRSTIFVNLVSPAHELVEQLARVGSSN